MNADNHNKEPQKQISQLEEELRLSRQCLQKQQQRVVTKRLDITRQPCVKGSVGSNERVCVEGWILLPSFSLGAEQRQHLEAQCEKISQLKGPEFLALIEGVPRNKVFITNVVKKLVFQDEQGNVISKSDGIVIGKIVEVKLVEPLQQSDRALRKRVGSRKISTHSFFKKPTKILPLTINLN